MRKAQKQRAEELVRQMEEAHDQLKKYIEQGSIPSAMELLEDCQNGGITLGTLIEDTEGEGHPTVSLLEEYCELSYQVHEQLSEKKEINANKIYKLLRQKLIRISNSLKNEVRVRLEIAFFPYKASMWDSLESVYLAAKADPDCDAYCVPIPYYDLNPDRSFGQMHYEGNVRPDGTPIEYPDEIEITDWQEYNFEERRPDVIFIHNIYDNYNLVTSVHPRYYSSNLKQYTDRLVYIPYYMTSGGMSEGQSFIPSYMNADYIVIQSPKFREYFDARIPDEKFLPFGSPKADRVIKKCQNPPAPPREWGLSDAQLKSMAGKKVYFYNTSISGMLADTENFLKKMQYVFQCFEEHENACILWRPHPLLEATFHSMRPENEDEYKRLKNYFVEKEIGILDTTADIEDSIALSDAYIGDAGTSVTALFGVAGKPVFVLNNSILKDPGERDWRKKIFVEFSFYYQDRIAVVQGKKMYISEPGQYHYKYFCDLPEDAGVNHYIVVAGDHGKWYACPLNAQHILVIGESGVEKKVELKKKVSGNSAFYLPQKYDKYLLLLPINYPAVVRYDTVTGETKYFTGNIDGFVREKNNQKITGGSLVYQGDLYIPSPTDNIVYKLDIESGKSSLIELPIQSRCGGSIIVENEGEIWLMPYNGRVIVRWNPRTNEAREYEGFPQDFLCRNPVDDSACMEIPFCVPAFFRNYIYLPPYQANMFLKLNIDTGEFEQWKPVFESKDNGIKDLNAKECCMFLNWKLKEEKDGFRLHSFFKNKLYNMSCDGMVFREIDIQFNDMQEIENDELGFCACSESLPYACIESCFNTLRRLLDGKLVGNQFSLEQQFKAYKEIAANYNGRCGEKVHDFIKNAGM